MAEPALQAQRKFLEAVLLVRVLFDVRIADYVDRRALSPACDNLLEGILRDPGMAGFMGFLHMATPPSDANEARFLERLASRADQLTRKELGFHNARTLVALVNRLPRMRSGRAEFKPLPEAFAA